MEEVYLNKGDLLNEKGQINEAGYAFSLIKKYNGIIDFSEDNYFFIVKIIIPLFKTK